MTHARVNVKQKNDIAKTTLQKNAAFLIQITAKLKAREGITPYPCRVFML